MEPFLSGDKSQDSGFNITAVVLGLITAVVNQPDSECASDGNHRGNATCCGTTKRCGFVDTERRAASP